jgi:D-alanine-D-alanine ligase
MGFSSFVFQQAAMVGIDHRLLILGLLGAATSGTPVTAPVDGPVAGGARRIHVVLGGTTSERQVSRQSGCFVGLSLLATGGDVRFFLMDLRSRYTEIGLFYVLHHDVEEIQALVGDPVRRATIEAVGAAVRAELAMGEESAAQALRVGRTVPLDGVAGGADFVFLALHGGPGEDGRLQLALDRLGCPYNGSGPRAADVAADKAATAARVRALGLPGVGAPAQREVDIFELGSWVDEMDRPGAAAARYGALCDELGARALVCKPAADGCSTGVKLLKGPEVMERFFTAVVAEAPEFVTGEARADLRGRTPTIAMPVPSPRRWLVERAFVDPTAVELPAGDLNLETLRPWFAAKQFVELTAAVLDRPGRGLVAAVPSVTVAAEELTLQQKFQSGVGTNLALDLFAGAEAAESVRRRVEQLARAFDIEGYARLDAFWDRVDDVVYLLEVNSLCGLTEATVFYSQWLADADPLPPWAVLHRIVEAGLERTARLAGADRTPRAG